MKKFYFLVMFIVLSAVLIACGKEEESDNTNDEIILGNEVDSVTCNEVTYTKDSDFYDVDNWMQRLHKFEFKFGKNKWA